MMDKVWVYIRIRHKEDRKSISELFIGLHDLGIPINLIVKEELKKRYGTEILETMDIRKVYARFEVSMEGLGKKRKSLESRLLCSEYLRYDFRYIQEGSRMMDLLFGETKVLMERKKLKKKIICLV
jgi:hypothetical protein